MESTTPISTAQLVLAYGGVSIPVGGVVLYIVKRLIESLLDSHRVLMSKNNEAIDRRLSITEKSLTKLTDSAEDLLVQISHLDKAVAVATEKMIHLERLIEKHDQDLHKVLPSIQTEIGRLSMYFKK